MEQLTVFYRIFHADLSPTIPSSIEKNKEYKEFLSHYSDMPGYPVPHDVILLPENLLRFYYYKVLLHKMVKEIEAELYQSVFVRGESEARMKSEVIKLQRYIDMHLMKIQRDFIPVSQHQTILEFSEAKDAIDIYKLAYHSLIDLQDYLEATFHHYLDEHIEVPCKQRKRFIKEQSPSAQAALSAIKSFDINVKLKEQVCSTIERFLSDEFNGFTYAQMKYCAKLNQVLNKFFKHGSSANEEEFILLLLKLNFNRNGVFQYVLEFIKVRLGEKETYCEKLELLSYHLKRINRIQHPSTFAYNKRLLSLKEQLVDWLEQQVEFISIKDIEVKNPVGVKTKKGLTAVKKHKVNLSVPESALLLRVLTKANVLDVPKDALFEYFSTHFYTKQSPIVSTGSLDKKYYNPSEKNLRVIKEALQRCLDCLEEIEAQPG